MGHLDQALPVKTTTFGNFLTCFLCSGHGFLVPTFKSTFQYTWYSNYGKT